MLSLLQSSYLISGLETELKHIAVQYNKHLDWDGKASGAICQMAIHVDILASLAHTMNGFHSTKNKICSLVQNVRIPLDITVTIQ